MARKAIDPTPIKKSDTLKAEQAFRNFEETKKLKHSINYNFLELAKTLRENLKQEYYKSLGQDSFEEYIAQPELSFDRSNVYKFIKLYETFVLKYNVAPARLAEISYTKLFDILPVVNDSNYEDWLSEATALPKSDLRKKLKAEEVTKFLERGTGETLKGKDYILYNEDSREAVKRIADDSVHLIVTSPPYNAGKTPTSFVDQMSYVTYRSLLLDVFSSSYQKLVNGGRIIVNIPSIFKIGEELYNFPLFLSAILEEAGYTYRDILAWIKSNDSEDKPDDTAWGSFASPSNPHLRSKVKFILIYQKESSTLPGEVSDIANEEFMAWTENPWSIQTTADPVHPAVLPKEVPHRLIKVYSWVGQAILDPFCGVGTTGVAAKELNRSFIGIDLSADNIKETQERIDATSKLELS